MKNLILLLMMILTFSVKASSTDQDSIQDCFYEVELQHTGDVTAAELIEMKQECIQEHLER